MREIWLMQPRFEKRMGSTPFGLAEQPRFRAAFDFMRLRADAGEVDETLADWWQEFSMASDDMRQDMVDQVRAEMQQKPRAPRVHRAPAPASAPKRPVAQDGETPQAAPEYNANSESGDADAPRKRRRRRRSGAAKGPAGGADGGASGAAS
jgi:poly(A) polymerase